MSAPTLDAPARPARAAGRIGVLAAAVTFAVGHLVAAVLDPGASPAVALGGAVVDATPPWLKDAAASLFGTADKVVLFVVMAAVVALAGYAVGRLAPGRPALASVLVTGLGAVCVVAAYGRPSTGPLAVLPALVGTAAGLSSLRLLLGRLALVEAAETREDPDGAPRRDLLRAGLVVGTVAAVAAVGGVVVGAVRGVARGARERLVLPAATFAAEPLPAGVHPEVEGLAPFVTPNGDFYRIDTALVVPQVDPETWRLRVVGDVAREVELTLDDLLARDLVEAHVTLTCVSNPVGGDLAGNATWLGLPVRELLAEAGPAPDADMVLSRSVDGFTASTPLEVLTDERDALLAVGMNGEPLPLDHGFPVRMVVPGLYGYVSATKWLTELRVTRFADATAYWTQRGWSARGPVKTASRIEVPRPSASVPAGDVVVAGTAWAQHRGITGVQVQVDEDGLWHDATLAAEASIETWRQWRWTWRGATPGRHTLRCRARDPDAVQDGEVAPVVPDGATGWHTIYVEVL